MSSLECETQFHAHVNKKKMRCRYVVVCILVDTEHKDKIFWSECLQAFTEFNLFLISSCVKFLFVIVTLRYLCWSQFKRINGISCLDVVIYKL